MNSKLLTGMCVFLGILGTWNTWTLFQVNKRLELIEQPSRPPSVHSQQSSISSTASAKQDTPEQYTPQRSTNNGTIPTPMPGQPSQSTIDLSDPKIQETIARIAESNAQKKEEQRRQSKMEAYKTSMKFELDNFANEKEYDQETVDNIQRILDNSTNEWRAVREQVRDGEISWIDARTEFKAIGEETEEKISEFISDEDYKELQSRLWGDWGK